MKNHSFFTWSTHSNNFIKLLFFAFFIRASYNLWTWGFLNNSYYFYLNVSILLSEQPNSILHRWKCRYKFWGTKKSVLKYALGAFNFFVSLKHESLLAGTARPSRAHKWYSVLTGYASVNDLYINKESMTGWFWIWSPGLNPSQTLALMIPDC